MIWHPIFCGTSHVKAISSYLALKLQYYGPHYSSKWRNSTGDSGIAEHIYSPYFPPQLEGTLNSSKQKF